MSKVVKGKNDIILYNDHAEIVITNRKKEIIANILIDLDDVDKVAEYKWCVWYSYANKNAEIMTYFATRINGKTTYLHRFIKGYFGSKVIDHVNRNTSDNRKNNLRIVSVSENIANNAGKHVFYEKDKKRWGYKVVFGGTMFRKRGFKTEEEATSAMKKEMQAVKERADELITAFNKQPKAKGVTLTPSGKYSAYYDKNGIRYNIGRFPTQEEAKEAREEFIKNIQK